MTELTAQLAIPAPEAPLRKRAHKSDGKSPPLIAGLIAAARPNQWPKNLLLFAAPAAAGVLTEPAVAAHALLAAAAFTLGSAATYFLNDLRDVEADRRHPTKCHRAFASGRISTNVGYTAAVMLAAAALVLAMTVGWMTLAGLSAYLVLTTTYSLYLKQFAVIDILAVALGFVLRAGTGALAAGVTVTSWFLLVTFFGALYIVTAKRQAELQSRVPDLKPGTIPDAPLASSRATLSLYSKSWLEQTLTLALTSAIICYLL